MVCVDHVPHAQALEAPKPSMVCRTSFQLTVAADSSIRGSNCSNRYRRISVALCFVDFFSGRIRFNNTQSELDIILRFFVLVFVQKCCVFV